MDATHPEETRIVVTNGNRLDEFDFESASRKQLRGNIYLAKVTRVEPSLQAAFVEYGGNRQGFLAFSEIHPDYYQIPIADKEALLAIEAEEIAASADADDKETDEEQTAKAASDAKKDTSEKNDDEQLADENKNKETKEDDNEEENGELVDEDTSIEQIGGIDPLDDEPEIKKTPIKRYKIQEVIKRRQIMLIQVVKEERGNKGAALTTNLSLAGRYSVLMPNTARGGGISRKITNSADRKRLKEVASELEVPQGMGVILRTAGASRTKAEIKRDFEYLMRLWENVRTLTLKTSAPCLVYEEGSLIKRTIRDLYNKDIAELFVAGAEAHIEAKNFMKMIMPTHEKRVKLYKGSQPIFSKYNVETQLNSMFSTQATLPSGGYIVINPTEALVSIDVNSGRATKERNIEATALQTNLEAAEEVARQLRLRDMAGLVVIDFIDMMEKRSVRSVEKKLKDALRSDRARIQIGRISHFGLLEMSRQRMRFGVLESSTNVCPTCVGAGIVRSTESLAIMVMRAIEDHVQRKPNQSINVLAPSDTALFLLNNKRNSMVELEKKYNLSITILSDNTLNGAGFQIEKGKKRVEIVANPTHISIDSSEMAEIEESEEDSDNEEKPNNQKRHPRRPNHNRNKNVAANNETAKENSDEEVEVNQNNEVAKTLPNDEEEPKKRRRRGRRGGRRNRPNQNEENVSNEENALEVKKDIDISSSDVSKVDKKEVSIEETPSNEQPSSETEKPKRKPRKPRKKQSKTDDVNSDDTVKVEKPAPKESTIEVAEKKKEKPKKTSKKKPIASDEIVVTSTKSSQEEKPSEAASKKPKKGGWWQRVF